MNVYTYLRGTLSKQVNVYTCGQNPLSFNTGTPRPNFIRILPWRLSTRVYIQTDGIPLQ